MEYKEGLSDEDLEALKKGEVIKCMDEGQFTMAVYMDPFGVIKEF